ncbi:MAG TPA: hypothetical protein VGR61_00815, partial [Candidatus Dormibacteraeota bacterium]|nr:hypothetical protein [Candidatus Dormibacteraeota bacterium]
QSVGVPAVNLPGGKRRLSLTLYWPGSDLALVVRDPSGRTLGDRGYGSVSRQPGLVSASLANPPAGRWSIEVRGKQVGTGGEDFFVSGAVDGSTPGQHFDSVVRGGPGSAGPFSELRDRFRLAITLGALVGGVAMLLMTVRGLARRLRARRLRQRLPGKFLVPALLYLGVIGGLGVLAVAAAANYLWETPLIQPPPI